MFQDINPDALFEKWGNIKKKPIDLHRIQLDRKVNEYHRDETVHNILTFIKMFPTHKYKFERSVTSLIVFSEVKLPLLVPLFTRSLFHSIFDFTLLLGCKNRSTDTHKKEKHLSTHYQCLLEGAKKIEILYCCFGSVNERKFCLNLF